MVRHASYLLGGILLYGTVLLLACVLRYISATSNITKTQNVSTNLTESPTNVMRKLILSLTDEKNYDKNIRPYFGENTIKVEVGIIVSDIISVSDYTNDLSLNLRIYQNWYDPRLQFTPINNLTKLQLVRDYTKLIWLPDTHIHNSKSLGMQLQSRAALSSARIFVFRDGYVTYRYTFTATVNCPMDLKYFPVDQQSCKLILGSYNYFNYDLKLFWNKSPVVINPDISLSTFTLISYNISKENFFDKLHDVLICKFRFKRTLGYYINQIFIPCFIIVVISWIPFWLARTDHYARVGMGITTVLTITTLITSTNESLPKTSYIKAIEIYLIVCFLMVFLAMVEFATIGYFESEQREQQKKKKAKPVTTVRQGKSNSKVKKFKLKASNEKIRNLIAWIDKVSRVLFPAVFITFNLAYVCVLFYISKFFY